MATAQSLPSTLSLSFAFSEPCLCSPPPHRLPVWLFWLTFSLIYWLSEFHAVWFSDTSGCLLIFRLVVILLLVVRGSEGFLPMPPSWPELIYTTSFLIFICHTWLWDQPVAHLRASNQSWCGFFFIFLVVVFQLDFRRLWKMVVL